MRLLRLFVAIWSLVCGVLSTSDGLQDLVTWDKYSLMVNNTRVYILAGEFHYQRLPVPELWLDVMQKIKANGFSAVSIYFFWSYHSAEEGTLDFETSGKNLQKLFDTAKEAGLYVIARPGPYCNAETNGGGLALWGSDGRMGKIRTSDETYYQAWLPYATGIGKIIAANQITNGGPVILTQIENEYSETSYNPNATQVVYMGQIEKAFRDAGITIPFSHNEKGMSSVSWSTDYKDVGSAVNVYGLDSYPGGFSCTNPSTGGSVVRNYYQWFNDYSFTQPSYLAEFEGGWFSDWGSTFYDQCTSEHDPSFADVYYKNNIGQRVTMLSIYMTYGGTNWGHSAAPVVYTSYDYSAPLRETRQQWSKLFQTKLIGLFARVSPSLLKTAMVGSGAGYRVSSKSVWSWVLQNPDTATSFTVIQQDNTRSTSSVTTSVTLNTTAGAVTVAGVNLDGRQSKILVTDYPIGNNTLLYSSADIAAWGQFDQTVVVMYLKEGQSGEFAFNGDQGQSVQTYGPSNVTVNSGSVMERATWTQKAGTTVAKFTNGVLVYLLDQPSAWQFWAPPTTSNPTVGTDEQIFVFGPYLVRNASVGDGVIQIFGDNENTTTIEVYAGNVSADAIVWNGKALNTSTTPYGSLTANLPGAEDRVVSLPALSGWQSADSLPEADPDFDDSNWKVCNKTTTLSPTAPVTLPVLYSSDYGYYPGTKIYRGYFDDATARSVDITCAGGQAFGWNAWLNGEFLGGNQGTPSASSDSATLTLPSSALKDKDNVVTVVVDYHGHDEASTTQGVENPRGILGARLLPSGTTSRTGFTQWKIQGAAGGSANIDPVRGPMNEGGLYGERMGWHLPGFNSSGWTASSPLDGIAKAGIQFYRTTFSLDIDADLDVPIGLEFSAPARTVARVMFWINGYQYGKFEPHIGPQTRFPVPPGVLNTRGENTLAVSLWAQTDSGAKLDGVNLISYGQYETGFNFDQDWSYLQPGWTDRQQYA